MDYEFKKKIARIAVKNMKMAIEEFRNELNCSLPYAGQMVKEILRNQNEMNLISCSACGSVIDINRIYHFESETKLDDLTNEERPLIKCPVCEINIFYHNGNWC